MTAVQEQVLYLSKDKKYLVDDEDNVISVLVKTADVVYYSTIGIESEAYEKVCTETRTRKVCAIWNDLHECLLTEDVTVCSGFELIPRGYSNIS
ncbi:hypothetical protein [Chitinophaga sp. XS-30]|uniref:hypothetical protein n=1 Tax=Chitinophaga sp. XS-30 TaxID=2604421 RepID=UPI0011DDE293|nr:hypothetical protein [Chitinophaga sp. XS-30]QEH39586.1 hypothetical protein FW415_01350 [Chitinophaga sp. XS-30]